MWGSLWNKKIWARVKHAMKTSVSDFGSIKKQSKHDLISTCPAPLFPYTSTETMAHVPDTSLFEHNARVREKVVVITGQFISSLRAFAWHISQHDCRHLDVMCYWVIHWKVLRTALERKQQSALRHTGQCLVMIAWCHRISCSHQGQSHCWWQRHWRREENCSRNHSRWRVCIFFRNFQTKNSIPGGTDMLLLWNVILPYGKTKSLCSRRPFQHMVLLILL